MDSGLVVPVGAGRDYLTLSVTEIREYGHDVASRSCGGCGRCSTSWRSSVLPERREAVLHELERLDEAVAARWGGTVDLDLAGRSDRQGIGGPDGDERSERLELLAAELTTDEARSLVFVFLASTLGAVLSRWHLRLVLPTVVVEIVLGIVIGPEVLGLAELDPYIDFLSDFGLALLFFFAGLEVIEHHVPRDVLRRGTIGWGMSLAIGLAVGLVLEQVGVDAEWWLLGVALATTALGTLVPILSDAGCSRRRSVAQCSGPESPASSGRSSSSPSSSRACTAR